MTGERDDRVRRLRVVEVMTMTDHDHADPRLHEVQAAKAALKMLPAADLRAALELRRRAVGGELA